MKCKHKIYSLQSLFLKKCKPHIFFQGGESKVHRRLEGALVEGGREEQRVGGMEEEEGG